MDTTRECCVCWQLYDDAERLPRMLPCGHTFCSPCMRGMLVCGIITCATCRTRYAAKHINEFQVNFALVQPKENPRAAQLQDREGSSYRRTLNALKEEQICTVQKIITSCKGTSDKLAQYSTELHHMVAKELELYGLLLTQLSKIKVSIDQVGEEARRVDEAILDGTKLENQLKDVTKGLSTAMSSPEIAETLDLSDATQEETQRWIEDSERKHLNNGTIARAAKTHGVMAEVLARLRHTTQEPYRTQYESVTASLRYLEPRPTDSTPCLEPHRTQRVSHGASLVDCLWNVLGGQTLSVAALRGVGGRGLVASGNVFAVHHHQGRRLSALVTCRHDHLCIPHLQDQPAPTNARTVPFSEVVSEVNTSSRLMFLDLAWPGSPSQRIVIKLSPDTPAAKRFFLLATGQQGSSYANTCLLGVVWKGLAGEYVKAGHNSKGKGMPAPPKVNWEDEVYRRPNVAGTVAGCYWQDGEGHEQFLITTRDNPDAPRDSAFGQVVSGLEVVRDAASHSSVQQVTITDCGVMI